MHVGRGSGDDWMRAALGTGNLRGIGEERRERGFAKTYSTVRGTAPPVRRDDGGRHGGEKGRVTHLG